MELGKIEPEDLAEEMTNDGVLMYQTLDKFAQSLTTQLTEANKTIEQLMGENKKQTDYSIALQRCIEWHRNRHIIPEDIFKEAPHHAQMLNELLKKGD